MRAHRNAVLTTAALLSAGVVFATASWAQNAPTGDVSIKPIGKVVSIKGAATVAHVNPVIVQASLGNQSAGTRIGDAVYLGDIIQTGADGKLGIAFTDGTAFDLTSNSRMVLNEFVYDPNSKSNSTFISLTKGTFTFVAGNIAKTGDMKIDTPVATMGIRGTTPHVEISDNGTVKFSTLLEDGKAAVVQKNGPLAPTAPIRSGDKPNLTICKGC